MTAEAHAYDLDEAVRHAAQGEVVYVARHGEQVAAVVPLDVAAAGVEALEDAEALAATRAALAEGGLISAGELHAELGL